MQLGVSEALRSNSEVLRWKCRLEEHSFEKFKHAVLRKKCRFRVEV